MMGPPRNNRRRRSSTSTNASKTNNRARNDKSNTVQPLSNIFLSRTSEPNHSTNRVKRHGRVDDDAREHDEENEVNLVDTIQALVEKERTLGEIRLREKEQEVKELQERLARTATDTRNTQVGSTHRIDEESKWRDVNDATGLIPSEPTQPQQTTKRPTVESVLAKYREGDTGAARDISTGLGTFGYEHRALNRLDFSDFGINEQDLRVVALQLKHLPNVTELCLSGNELGNSATQSLVLLAKEGSMLTHLDLHKNSLELDPILALLGAFEKNNKTKSLSFLDISDNPISRSSGAQQTHSGAALGRAINDLCARCSLLTHIRVTVSDPRRDRSTGTNQSNTAQFVSALIDMDGDNKRDSKSTLQLRALGMVGATLFPSTVRLLTRERVLHALKSLDLSYAFIGSSGASLLGRALLQTATTHTLEHINLKCNAIGTLGAKAILAAVSSSSTLSNISICRNDLGSEALAYVTRALANNQRISTLDITHNPMLATADATTCLKLVDAVCTHAGLISLGAWSVLNLEIATLTQLRSLIDTDVTARFCGSDIPEMAGSMFGIANRSIRRLIRVHSPKFQIQTGSYEKDDGIVVYLHDIVLGRRMLHHAGCGDAGLLRVLVRFTWNTTQCERARTNGLLMNRTLLHSRQGRLLSAIDCDGSVDSIDIVLDQCEPEDILSIEIKTASPRIQREGEEGHVGVGAAVRRMLEHVAVLVLSTDCDVAKLQENGGDGNNGSVIDNNVIAPADLVLYDSPWLRTSENGTLEYQVLLQQVTLAGQGFIRIRWEASTDHPNMINTSNNHQIQWQLFRDMESIPLQHGLLELNPGSSSGTHTIGGFNMGVVDLVPSQVLIGDTLILRLRALSEERGEGDDRAAIQIRTRNVSVVVVWTPNTEIVSQKSQKNFTIPGLLCGGERLPNSITPFTGAHNVWWSPNNENV